MLVRSATLVMSLKQETINIPLFLVVILVVLAILTIVYYASVIYSDFLLLPVYAGEAARDYDEKYEDIPGANECWYDGYLDGENNSYNHGRGDECKDRGSGSGQSST